MTASAVAPFRWPYGVDLPLLLTIASADGTGATGKTPEVSIRRLTSAAGALLDLHYWDGAAFTASETWLAMTEISASTAPGRYRYLFDAPLSEYTYLVNYRHTSTPVGIDTEIHTVTKQVDPSAGARAIDVTVEDADDDPVPGVVVDVFDSTETLHLLRMTDLDLDGNVTFNLEDGTYKIRLTGPRFTPDNATETLIVNGDKTVTYTGTVLSPPVASDPSMCTVWGYVTDAAGAPIDGATIDFMANSPMGVGNYVLAARATRVTSGPTVDGDHDDWAAGYFEIDLVRESDVRMRSNLTKLDDLIITIPDAGSVELADLIEEART